MATQQICVTASKHYDWDGHEQTINVSHDQ